MMSARPANQLLFGYFSLAAFFYQQSSLLGRLLLLPSSGLFFRSCWFYAPGIILADVSAGGTLRSRVTLSECWTMLDAFMDTDLGKASWPWRTGSL